MTTNDEFAARALKAEKAGIGWWPFSYGMLWEIARDYQPKDESILQRLHQSMRAGGERDTPIFRITRKDRFADMDSLLADLVVERDRRGQGCVVMDLGCSNGITSLDWYDRIKEVSSLQFTCADKYTKLYKVHAEDRGWEVVFNEDRQPLQFIGHRMVLSGIRPEPARYPVNVLAAMYAKHVVLPSCLEALNDYLDAGDVDGGVPGFDIDSVSLFHPRCVTLSVTDTRFRLASSDVLSDAPETLDVLRVQNLLTKHHFSGAVLGLALQTCIRRVKDGGLFVVGRNADERDGELRATVYEKVRSEVRPLHKLHGGYEHDDLVIACEFG